MTPEQHHAHGVDLLAQAEAAVDPAIGDRLARQAIGNLLAALSGNELRDRGLRSKPPEVGDTVVIVVPTAQRNAKPRRLQGTVTTLFADGTVAADIDQGDGTFITITALSEQFAVIAARRQ